jgi:hypothetical protein
MTTTHAFFLFATVATLGACSDKDIDASDDSGTPELEALLGDDTGAMDTGDFDAGVLTADDAEDDEADPTVPEDTGVFEKDDSADGSGSNERTSLDDVGTVPAATDLGSAIGPSVATGPLPAEPNNWYELCVDLPYDYPDASFWWTPPVTGTYTLSTFGSTTSTSTTLTVLKLGHDGFTSVACNDNSQVVDPAYPLDVSGGQGPNYWHSIIEDQVLTAGDQYMLVIEASTPYVLYHLNIDLVSEAGDPGPIDSDRGE